MGRLFCGFYECLCCPDPCYTPHYVPAADAAFFVDAPRPVTRMGLRIDGGFDMARPDRAEYFWARQGSSGSTGRGPTGPVRSLDYEELMMRAEVASGAFGAFVDTPYRHWDAEIPGQQTFEASGFVDLTIGTKSMFLDCELVQGAFQFKTFVPAGSAGGGVGTGHVSLEPSLLFAVKLGPKTYLQEQIAYWIPIAGDKLYQGNVFHNHLSVNHVLWQPAARVQLVGTLEFNEYTVMNGNASKTTEDR